MNKGQILLVVGAIALVIVLFFYGNTVPPEKESADKPLATAAFDIDTYIREARQSLSDSHQEQVLATHQQLTDRADNNLKAAAYTNLAGIWEETDPMISAYYLQELAQLTPTSANWEKAGSGFLSNIMHKDTTIRAYAISNALKCLESSLEADPDNSKAKVNMALCYIDGLNQVMTGVQLLLKVVESDPEHIEANLVLGRLAVRSGQFDKAIERLEKIVAIDTTLTEAYFHLAEAYRNNGDKEKAVDALEKCKLSVDNPAFRSEVDQLIKNISNS